MHVTWILDPDAFPDDHQQLVAEIQAQGHVAQTLPPFVDSYIGGDSSHFYNALAPAKSCVVCHASFEFTEFVADDELWTPGAYGGAAAIPCSSYYPRLPGVLLNDDHEFVPWGDLTASANSLFQTFGADERIFLRPDSGEKPFTGRLLSRAEFEQLRPAARISPQSLVLVSGPKSLRAEWRFIVVDGQIVAASGYRLAGQIHKSPDVPASAHAFASPIAEGNFQPDRAWVLDVCETAAGEMRVVEINGFSNSDWYRCDVKSIVTTVSRIALDDWARGRTP